MPSERKFGGMRFSIIQVAIVVGVCAPVLGAQRTVPGWYVEAKITSRTSPGTRTDSTHDRLTKTWIVGSRQRIVGLGSISSTFPADAYMVLRGPGPEMYTVSPSTRSIHVMNRKSMLQDLVSADTNAFKKSLQVTDLGDGGRILGHATRLYQLKTHIDMRMPLLGDSSTRGITAETKVWLATDMGDPLIAAAMNEKAFVATTRGLPPGIALRTETSTGTADGAALSVSTMNVVLYRRADIDTMIFVLPEGYKRVKLADEMRAMRLRLDSVMRAMKTRDPKRYAQVRRMTDSVVGKRELTFSAPRVSASAPGWYIEAREVTHVSGQRLDSDEIIKTWRANGNERVERVGTVVTRAELRGVYTVRLASGDERFTVRPSTRTIEVSGPADARTRASDSGLQAPQLLEQRVQEKGDGGRVLGYATRLIHIRTVFRTVVSVPGKTANRTDTTLTQLWMATDASDTLVAAAVKERGVPTALKNLPRGVVLRSIRTIEHPIRTITNYEVARFGRQRVDSALFVLPRDYKRISQTEAMRATLASSDSSLKALARKNPAWAARIRAREDSVLGQHKAAVNKKPTGKP